MCIKISIDLDLFLFGEKKLKQRQHKRKFALYFLNITMHEFSQLCALEKLVPIVYILCDLQFLSLWPFFKFVNHDKSENFLPLYLKKRWRLSIPLPINLGYIQHFCLQSTIPFFSDAQFNHLKLCPLGICLIISFLHVTTLLSAFPLCVIWLLEKKPAQFFAKELS